jgi:hypothetical protein
LDPTLFSMPLRPNINMEEVMLAACSQSATWCIRWFCVGLQSTTKSPLRSSVQSLHSKVASARHIPAHCLFAVPYQESYVDRIRPAVEYVLRSLLPSQSSDFRQIFKSMSHKMDEHNPKPSQNRHMERRTRPTSRVEGNCVLKLQERSCHRQA